MHRYFFILLYLIIIQFNSKAQTHTGFRIGNNVTVAGSEGVGTYFGFQSAWYIDVETFKSLNYCVEFKISSLGYTLNENEIEKIYKTSIPILLSYRLNYHRPQLFLGIEPIWNMYRDRREPFYKLPDKYKLNKKDSYTLTSYTQNPFGCDLVAGTKLYAGKTDLFLFANIGITEPFVTLSLSIGLNHGR